LETPFNRASSETKSTFALRATRARAQRKEASKATAAAQAVSFANELSTFLTSLSYFNAKKLKILFISAVGKNIVLQICSNLPDRNNCVHTQ